MVLQSTPERYFARVQAQAPQTYQEPIIPSPQQIQTTTNTYEITTDMKLTILIAGVSILIGLFICYLMMRKK